MGDLQLGRRRPDGEVLEGRQSQSSDPNRDPYGIGADRWAVAEQAGMEVVSCTRPSWASDQKRKEVIEHFQSLISSRLNVEVFTYGSVPLRTYLPDGDIDLTALGSGIVDEVLARHVLAVLQAEEHNENAEYEVKDTQFIDAEVKLVKCLVQNIVIDISFNQLGGLCTLCFLEQVDRLVGKDHLFKRSIILVKAWCYYESRILGAHHGLISTYALETLVLYIFHLFHSSLNGPLAVLYRFLEYFGKFDWENYCISLNGPVRKSSLPDIVVELPENCKDDLMLSEEFLRNCMEMFSVPSRGLETNIRPFPQKHLNIIDPLKENNNLGRSVHRGNFYRICSAFKYGARKLGQILLLPSERIADEIKKFFANTLQRHGSKYDADLQSHDLTYDLFRNEPVEYSPLMSEMGCLANGISASGCPPPGDANSKVANGTFDCSPQDSRFCFSHSFSENGKFENGDLCQEKSVIIVDDNVGSDCLCTNECDGPSSSGSGISTQDINILGKCSLNSGERGDLDILDPLLELSGDYDNHIRCLLEGLCRHGFTGYLLSNPPPPTTQLWNKKPWETVRQSMPLKRNSYSRKNSNCAVFGQMFYTVNNLTSPRVAFGSEEKTKARGTGTYFPKTNGYSFRERPSQRKGRNPDHGHNGHLQTHSNNYLAPAVDKTKSCKEEIQELSHPWSPVQGQGKSGLPCCPSHHPISGNSMDNGFSIPTEKLEFGSFNLTEEDSHLTSGTSRSVTSTFTVASTEMESPKPVRGNDQERLSEWSYRLKNEVDFPPLSV